MDVQGLAPKINKIVGDWLHQFYWSRLGLILRLALQHYILHVGWMLLMLFHCKRFIYFLILLLCLLFVLLGVCVC